MPFTKAMTVAAAMVVFGAGAALAQEQTGPKIYAYGSQHNFCPAGLQPVTVDGTICCGQPNQEISYQQALAHATKRRVHRVRKSSCPVGAKGCSFN